jgi:NTE family protein
VTTQGSAARAGLVLGGGGAKGAYQVGVIRALAEAGFEPWAVAGTSIGALNGAIVASSRHLPAAAAELRDLWTALTSRSIVRPKAIVSMAFQLLRPWVRRALDTLPSELLPSGSVLDPAPIVELMKQTVAIERIAAGRRFWVTVFP